MDSRLRALPSVDQILSDERVRALVTRYTREIVTDIIRVLLNNARRDVVNGQMTPKMDEIVYGVKKICTDSWRMWPRRMINATGVLLHTNLGRAPLSQDALINVQEASKSYSELELNIGTGIRGSRNGHIGRLLCQLTGAESAMVVNNNASAILLGLASITRGKEVIVSRGEAVEIGGGFRIPEVLGQSGAILVDVGTTNRTYVDDYEAAISDNTGAILSIHTSNFDMTGFTHSPTISELVALGKKYQKPVLHDLGSGCLLDTSQFDMKHEPMPQESIEAGVSLAFFSGDKLLGGPQSGIIVGKSHHIDIISNHPLARAFRADKMTLSALTATLMHYVLGEAMQKIPIWRMISTQLDFLEKRAREWADAIGENAEVVSGRSAVGGGSLPGVTLPTVLLSLDASEFEGGADALALKLRQGNPPVIGRIEDEKVLLDPRSVIPEEDKELLNVLGIVFL